MDLLKPFEKTGIACLNKHNIYDEPNKTHYELPKIDNTQWSATNDLLRMSSTSGNYDTIADSTREHTEVTNHDNTESGRFESIANSYLSFTNGMLNWTPTLESNERTPGYAYANPNREIRFSQIDNLDHGQYQSTLHSNVGNLSDPQFKYSPYDNASSKYAAQISQSSEGNNYLIPVPGQTKQVSQYQSESNNYLVPVPGDSSLENNGSRKSDPKCGLRDTQQSDYAIGRVCQETGRIQLPETKIDKRKCSKCKIVIFVLFGLLVAAAAVITVIMLNKKEDDSVCDDLNECLMKCQNYTDIANGQTNVTEEVSLSTSVQISCNKGFKVDGGDTAVCLETGKWSKDITCEPVNCGKYHPPNNVHISQYGHATTFGTSVDITCESGYQFTDDSDTHITCNEHGEWVGNPKCENLVDLSTDTDIILMGGTASMSCEFKKIPNWENIHFKRISRHNETITIASIKNNIDSYELTVNSGKISIVEKTFTHEAGKFHVMFDTVQCTDAFEEPGEIKVVCDVDFGDTANTYRDEKIVRIQGQAAKPELYLSPHVIEGEDTTTYFHCEMLFPEPNGHVLIETDLDGSFTTLLSSLNGESGNDVAWIEDMKIKLESCWYRIVVTFGLKKVSMKWHRKHIRCTAKPSEDAVNQTVFTSGSEVVKVIQENVCSGKVSVPYPYDCGYFITCDDNDNYNSVLEVRACDENQCYDEQTSTCSSCSSTNGCPVIDMYFFDGRSGNIGGQLDIFCVVENFKGLTDIKITRANGEFVSSIRLGDNIDGFKIMPHKTYLNNTNGVLAVHVGYLVCTDKATYRCLPEGSETSDHDDVIDLDFNC